MSGSDKKEFIMLGCTAGISAILLAVFMLLRKASKGFCEFVCRYFTQPLVFVSGSIASLFPFSLFEFIIVTLIVFGIALFVLMIKALIKKRYVTVLKGLIVVSICVLCVFNLYAVVAGLAYHRKEAPVPQSEVNYASEQVTQMARYFSEDYNALALKFERDEEGNVISPYTINELGEKLRKEYKRLDDGYFFKYTPRPKGIANSWFLTLTDVCGITFLPLNEPTVNTQIPPSSLPFTMAHETAHSKGVMREGDANFVAYYILLSSNNDYLRYCGYFATFYSFLSAVNADSSIKDDYNELYSLVSPLILKELKNQRDFWNDKSNRPGVAGAITRAFENLSERINDLFLKSNGVENGSESYYDKITDGEIVDTGIVEPDTGEIKYEVTYSSIQKMYFYIYEQRTL